MEAKYKKLKAGDKITVIEKATCYYFNYPSGHNLDGVFNPGDIAFITGFPVSVTGKSGSHFILFDVVINGKEYRFGEPYNNIQKIK